MTKIITIIIVIIIMIIIIITTKEIIIITIIITKVILVRIIIIHKKWKYTILSHLLGERTYSFHSTTSQTEWPCSLGQEASATSCSLISRTEPTELPGR